MFCIKSFTKLSEAEGDIKLLSNGVLYQRTLPRYNNRDILPPSISENLERFTRHLQPNLPREWGATLHDAYTMKHGLTITNENAIIEESLYNHFNRNEFYGFKKLNGGYTHAEFKSTYHLSTDLALLRLTTEDTFGHWLVELLPRLSLYETLLDPHLSSWKIGISASSKLVGLTLRALQMLGYQENRIIQLPDSPVSVDRMYFSSVRSLYPGWISPFAISFLQRLLPRHGQKQNGLRLFVTRNDASDRHLTNIEEIQQLLSKYGYQRIDTGTLDFQEQIELFSRAKSVVGIIGSALANIVFCETATPIIFLSPDTMAGTWFYDLASIKNLPYSVVYGPASQRKKSYRSDFSVCREDVQAALDSLELSA